MNTYFTLKPSLGFYVSSSIPCYNLNLYHITYHFTGHLFLVNMFFHQKISNKTLDLIVPISVLN